MDSRVEDGFLLGVEGTELEERPGASMPTQLTQLTGNGSLMHEVAKCMKKCCHLCSPQEDALPSPSSLAWQGGNAARAGAASSSPAASREGQSTPVDAQAEGN